MQGIRLLKIRQQNSCYDEKESFYIRGYVMPAQEYVLKKQDDELLRFRLSRGKLEDYRVIINGVSEENRESFPFGVHDEETLLKWCRNRVIPGNRQYSAELLASQNIEPNDLIGLLNISLGLSLNDCYWVVPPEFEGKFDDFNLYENSFSEALSLIAYTGRTTSGNARSLSPEWTTNGSLPKCWRRIDDRLYLFKGGNDIDPNEIKYEPQSEFYVSEIAEHLDIRHAQYSLEKWEGKIASVCECFCNKEFGFVPAHQLLGDKASYQSLKKLVKALGCEKEFSDMILLDAVTFNIDRHLENFGFMVRNGTNTIEGMAPLFDHGLCLFGNLGEYSFHSKDLFEGDYKYAQLSHLWDIPHRELLADNVSSDTFRKLRSLLDYRIPGNGRYDLPEERIRRLETLIHERCRELMEYLEK